MDCSDKTSGFGIMRLYAKSWVYYFNGFEAWDEWIILGPSFLVFKVGLTFVPTLQCLCIIMIASLLFYFYFGCGSFLKLFHSPGDLPNPGIEPRFPALQVDSLPVEPSVKPIFKVFVEFMIVLLLFHILFFYWPWGMWELSSLTRDQTHTPCIGKQNLNHWTTREVPQWPVLIKYLCAEHWMKCFII